MNFDPRRTIRLWVWGRSPEESASLAEAEAAARYMRLLARADGNGCYIVLAPEIEGSYCEIHRRPVLPGESDLDHLTRA